jgi:pyruvate dehydrogenase E1 component beta subunit
MEEGKLTRWLVREGDQVSAGDVIAEIETDKATMEVEAADEGRLGRILIPAGTEKVKINTPIAVIINGVGTTVPHLNQADSSQNGARLSHDITAPTHCETTPAQPEAVPLTLVGTSSPAAANAFSPALASVSTASADDDLEIASDAETVTITMREALRDAMAEEMRADDRVFLMGEEVAQYQGAYKVSQGLLDEFGDKRVIDTPITEHGFAGVGVGAALGGLHPIIEFMTWNFAMQAMDQIINSAAKTLYMSGGQMRCPIVFRGPNGAASRVAAQHSQDYSAWYAHVPGLKVVAPSTPADAKGLMKAAIRDPNPVVFLENEILYGVKGEVPTDTDWTLPIGKARIARKGRDVTIVSFARCMVHALDAATQLAEAGIEAEVIDLRTLRPLDITTILESVKRTNRLVTVEESWPVCSVGSEICARVAMEAFDYLDAPPAKVSAADVPLPYAANLEKQALPSVEQVVEAVKLVLYR